MNATGCPSNLAHDNLFLFEDDPEAQGSCTLVVPLFLVYFIGFIILTLLVAIGRTQHVWIKSTGGGTALNRFRIGHRQVVTLIQAWGAFFSVVAMMVIPLAIEKPPHQAMSIIIGFASIFYHISAQGWMYKLLRLGARIIDPKSSMEGMEDAGKYLAQQDTILKILIWSINAGIVLQIVSFILLAPLYPTQKRWVLLGIGLSSYTTLAGEVTHVYQYQRCKNAVITISKRVQANRLEDHRYAVVLSKFTRHQIILLLLGLPGTLISLLYAVEVIPLNAYFVFCYVFFDSGTNAAMFFTYALRQRTHHSGDRPTSSTKNKDNKMATSNSDKRGKATTRTMPESTVESNGNRGGSVLATSTL